MKTDYDHIIRNAAAKHLPEGYDWRLFKAQLFEESGLDPRAQSGAGAKGIGQFTDPTWGDWAPKAGYEGFKVWDAEANIYTSALYMAWLIKEWRWERPTIDRWCLAMASYNAGLGNILDAQAAQGGPSLYYEIIAGLEGVTGADDAPETINYVRKILKNCAGQVTEGA